MTPLVICPLGELTIESYYALIEESNKPGFAARIYPECSLQYPSFFFNDDREWHYYTAQTLKSMTLDEVRASFGSRFHSRLSQLTASQLCIIVR